MRGRKRRRMAEEDQAARLAAGEETYPLPAVPLREVGAEDEEAVEAQGAGEDDGGKIILFPVEHIRRTQYAIEKALSKSMYERVCFVANALSRERDETRLFKLLIRCEKDEETGIRRIVGTDGRRIHLAEISLDLPEGNYQVRTDRSQAVLIGPLENDETVYPNYRKIIFEDQEELCPVDFYGTGLGKNELKNHKMSKEFAQLIRKDKLINLRFLDDLAKVQWTAYTDKRRMSKAVIFKCDSEPDMLAVIMPIADED